MQTGKEGRKKRQREELKKGRRKRDRGRKEPKWACGYKVSLQLPSKLNRFLNGLLSPPMNSFKGPNYKTPNYLIGLP